MSGTDLWWCCTLYTVVKIQISRRDGMGNRTTELQIKSPTSTKVKHSNHSATRGHHSPAGPWLLAVCLGSQNVHMCKFWCSLMVTLYTELMYVVYVSLYVCFVFCLCVSKCVCVSCYACLAISVSNCLSLCLSRVFLTVWLCVCVCLCVCVSAFVCVCVSMCVPVCVSVCEFTS